MNYFSFYRLPTFTYIKHIRRWALAKPSPGVSNILRPPRSNRTIWLAGHHDVSDNNWERTVIGSWKMLKHGGGSIMLRGFQQQGLSYWSGLRESLMKHEQIYLMKTWSRVLRTSDWAKGSPSNRTITLSTQPGHYRRGLGTTWEDLWRDLKMAVYWRSLTGLERICREEWQKIPKSRCAKLVASHPRRLEAVITAKVVSTKYWVNGLNTYINAIYWVFQMSNPLKKCFALSWGIDGIRLQHNNIIILYFWRNWIHTVTEWKN